MTRAVLWSKHQYDFGPFNKINSPWNKPIIDEQPGPPFSLHRNTLTRVNKHLHFTNQSVKGAVSGLFRASKNQNHCRNEISY